MQICYVDESGDDSTLLSATAKTQPILVISGLIVDYASLHALTLQLLQLKTDFYPNLAEGGPHLNRILPEIKGSEVRKKAAQGTHRERRHAVGVLDRVMKIVEDNNVRVVARVWIKGIGAPFNGRAVYTSSVQAIYGCFQYYLNQNDDLGVVIADSRTFTANVQVSHSIFTQKFKQSGDEFDRVIDLPTFAHSNNHAALQLTDLVCSGILAPLAIDAYCSGYVQNQHVRPGYAALRARFADKIRTRQFRYREASGRWRGGITIADGHAARSGTLLFPPRPMAAVLV